MQGIHNNGGTWHCTVTSKYVLAVPGILAKKEEKEPKNPRSVKWDENHLFTILRLGWKETVARGPKEKKGDLPT